jgi:DNA-binding NarL/FixJ family response regulator
MNTLNILVVEDDPLIAEDLRGYLLEFGHHVTGPVNTVAAAKRFISSGAVDAAILDINLGNTCGDGGSEAGCDLGEWISRHHPLPFIYLTSHSDTRTVDRAMGTHPGGYVLKPFTGAEIRVALEVALVNFRQRRHEQLHAIDVDGMSRSLTDPLSMQEIRVLLCVEEGLTNRQTGERLFISENTVKTHLKHIFEKLGVSTRTEALHKARFLSRPQL